MDPCLCHTVRQLAEVYDESRAKDVIPALNRHLRDLRALLTRSKALTHDVQYRITPNNHRTLKALSVETVNLAPIDQLHERFKDDVDGFWAPSADAMHIELRRRLSCVIIFLRSQLDAEVLAPPQITRLFPGQPNYAELRNSGRKYIKIARKLGGLGSILWLPLDIPASTYERYLNMDDDEVFSHLNSLDPQAERYADFVQRLILSQIRDPSSPCWHYNLVVDYDDVIPASDHLLLLLHALGGSGIPDVLVKSVHFSQRRWNAAGEIESISAAEFGVPAEVIKVLLDETNLTQATENSSIIKHVVDDGTIAWSLCPELRSFFSHSLLPRAIDELGITALKLICFACPPCYEGNTNWSSSLKKAVWPILETAAAASKLQGLLRTHVLEAMLYFGERDSVGIRHIAMEQARSLLRKSMPYYLHASVVLFQGILSRLDGELVKSEAQMRDFLWRGPKPSTRRDHALLGRLHISQVENKIKCYDSDVTSFIYKWEAEQPLSTLDIEVTSRLQTAAARFFQSVGDFAEARASLEQFLSLNAANPIRANTRRLVVGRLADVCCEMKDYAKTAEIIQPELDAIAGLDRLRRPFRRLMLASVEASIGLGKLDAAELTLKELKDAAIPLELDDLYDQQLHMRKLFAAARIAHMRPDPGEAVLRWKFALQEVERMHALKSKVGFTAALVYVSMAHAQLGAGDRDGAWHAWAAGMEILRRERCEFWIPIVPTVWLRKVAAEVHEFQGWTFRLMFPGGMPDIQWP